MPRKPGPPTAGAGRRHRRPDPFMGWTVSPPPRLPADLPTSLADIVTRLLQKDPAARYPKTTALAADLDQAWEVLAEPVQTVMRRHGLPDPYAQLKDFTRGRPMTRETMREFIAGLALPPAERERLLALTPADYTGMAASLARRMAGPG